MNRDDRESELLDRGLEHHRNGRLEQAVADYQAILRANPVHGDALYLLGMVAHQTGHSEPAIELIGRAVAIAPDQPEYFNGLGLALLDAKRHDEAGTAFERAIALSDSPDFQNNLGNLRREQGRLDDAIKAYRSALRQNPRFANAHYNLGNAWRAKNAMEEAAASFRLAIAEEPDHAHALAALAQTLRALNRVAEGIEFLQRAVALLPDDAGLHAELADLLHSVGRLDEAVDEYRRSLQLDPAPARVWYSAGCAENSRKEPVAAVFCYRKALERQPDWAEARHNLGQPLFELGQIEEALEQYEKSAAVSEADLSQAMIATMIPMSPAADNQAVLDARRAWAGRSMGAARPRRTFAKRGDRLRIGYVSSFFHQHNWMKTVWALINQHDRARFEVHLFSDAPESAIVLGYRKHTADRFHDITGLSNDDVADRVAEIGIDVLVDLNGYSKVQRLPLFMLRPAPVIVGWFNMFATTGMDGFDYLIGDDEVIPPDEERFYCEKIVRVPGSYLTFEVGYPVPEVADAPCHTTGAITFGCLAPMYKIGKQVIAAWSTILRQTPNSRLILKNTALASRDTRQFVHSLFRGYGIAAERVHLEGPAEHFEFLKTYDRIDLALDTFPYNGGNTTIEAIWQAVPVLTFRGDRWASRTSASILRAADLGEFVAADVDEYIAHAIEFGTACDKLAELRAGLRERVAHSKVCDTKTFARDIQQIYRELS